MSSTNLIESCFARTAAWTRRVKRWRNAKMVLRWGAAALLVAEKGFRHLQGHEHLHELIVALTQHQTTLAPFGQSRVMNSSTNRFSTIAGTIAIVGGVLNSASTLEVHVKTAEATWEKTPRP